jgi:Tol biopolymer transport system component
MHETIPAVKRSRPTFLAIAVALGLAFAASTAAPALAGPEEVAYGCGEKDICLIDPDNAAAVRNLTTSGAGTFYYDPVWSPDGTKLAFIRLSGGTRNIYVMAPFVSGAEGLAKPVTEYADGTYVQNLAWSPDGTEIAFQRGVSEANYEVLVANSDGTTAVPLKIAEHGLHPSWAPDGGKITYSYGEQVYLRNADASAAATPLPNGAGHDPVWSPDGALIAFDGINTAQKAPFSDVHIVSATGGGTPVVVPSNYTQWTFLSWAPGGSKLAYRSTQNNFGYARVADRTGAGDHALAGAGTVAMRGPASWSPDGGRVVFYSFDGAHKIYIANTDGSGSAKPLIVVKDGNSDPSWRPNPAITPTFPGSPSEPGTPSLPITPSGGSNQPLPKTKPARVIWTSTGLPYQPHGYIQPLNVACGAKDCGVNSTGYTKASKAAGLSFRSLLPFEARAKAKPKNLLVARGKMKVPAGKSKPVKLRLTKAGLALIEARGAIKMKITVKITVPGETTVVKSKTVRVYLAKSQR